MPKFYDELNRLDYETEVVNGVVTSFTDYDQRNLNVWYSNNTIYDAQGRVDISTLLYDDGSKTVFDTDQNNSGAWAFTTTVFDSFSLLITAGPTMTTAAASITTRTKTAPSNSTRSGTTLMLRAG